MPVKQKHPADETRDLIAKALEAIQDDRTAEKSLGLLASTLAGSQSNLFDASKFPPNHPVAIEDMRKAMEFLARALQLLQDLKAESKVESYGQAAEGQADRLVRISITILGVDPVPAATLPASPSRPN